MPTAGDIGNAAGFDYTGLGSHSWGAQSFVVDTNEGELYVTHLKASMPNGVGTGTSIVGITDHLPANVEDSYAAFLTSEIFHWNPASGVIQTVALTTPITLTPGATYWMILAEDPANTNPNNSGPSAYPRSSIPVVLSKVTSVGLCYYRNASTGPWSGPLSDYTSNMRAYTDGSTPPGVVGVVGNSNFENGTAFGNYAAYTFTVPTDTWVTDIEYLAGGGGAVTEVGVCLGLPADPTVPVTFIDHVTVAGGVGGWHRDPLPGGPLLLTAGTTYAMVWRRSGGGTTNILADNSALVGSHATIVAGVYYNVGGTGWSGPLTPYAVAMALYGDGTGPPPPPDFDRVGYGATHDAGMTAFSADAWYSFTVPAVTYVTHMEFVDGGGGGAFAGSHIVGIADTLASGPFTQTYLDSVEIFYTGTAGIQRIREPLPGGHLALIPGITYYMIARRNGVNQSVVGHDDPTNPPITAATATASYGGNTSSGGTVWHAAVPSWRLGFCAYADGTTPPPPLTDQIGYDDTNDASFTSGVFGANAAYYFQVVEDVYATHVEMVVDGSGAGSHRVGIANMLADPAEDTVFLDSAVITYDTTPGIRRLRVPLDGEHLLLLASGDYFIVALRETGTAGVLGVSSTVAPPISPLTSSALYGLYCADATTDGFTGPMSPWRLGISAYTDGTEPGPPPEPSLGTGKTLGNGYYEVYLADRGGGQLLGRITGIARLRWGRIRDDISQANIIVENPNPTCANLLKNARTVRNEVVIFRNGIRVWEGPIIRLEYGRSQIEIDVRDVLWFSFRRALNPGTTWHSQWPAPFVNAIAGMLPVLQQVYGDGTVDPYGYQVGKFLTPIYGPVLSPGDPGYQTLTDPVGSTDPYTRREFMTYSRTVWEVFDSLAEDGGIDYVVTGRRITWFDVHLRPKVLNRLSDGDFLGSLFVTEYGSDLTTGHYQTNNEGVARIERATPEWEDFYGPVERVANVVEEQPDPDKDPDDPDPPVTTEVEGNTGEITVPAPLVLRVPNNIGLNPNVALDINDLIPGAWVPVYSTLTVRPLEQWMKLHEVTVTVESGNEVINVTLIQAPSQMIDPPTAGPT